MVVALWAAVSLAEPVPWADDPAAPPFAAPVEGRLAGGDARDGAGRPFDAYVLDAPPGTWVEVTVHDHAFPLRVRVGDEAFAFPEWSRGPSVGRAWSKGGRLVVEVGTTDDGLRGPYSVSVALIPPASSEPPAADGLPPYVKIEPTAWADGGWFCDLVTASFATAREFTVGVQAEDAGRMRLLVGRWEGGLRLEAESVPGEGARRPSPLEVRFEAGVPRVFGVCRDRLGTAYLGVRTPDDAVAPGSAIDPSRTAASLDEAAAGEQAALEGPTSVVVGASGEASRYHPIVVPLFLQSGFDYEIVALTEDDSLPANARLLLRYCDAACEAFAAKAGMTVGTEGEWFVLALPDGDEVQRWTSHAERWRFTWLEGTSATAMLQVFVPSVAARRVHVVVGEDE